MDTLIRAGVVATALRYTAQLPIGASRSTTYVATSYDNAPSAQRSLVHPYGNSAYRNALVTLHRISNYQEDWDSYGGRPISRRAVQVAQQLLELLATADLPVIDVVPASSGGVQIEWQANLADVEVFVSPDGLITVSRMLQNGDTSELIGTLWEGTWQPAPAAIAR